MVWKTAKYYSIPVHRNILIPLKSCTDKYSIAPAMAEGFGSWRHF